MITQEDMDTARRMCRRWTGNARFDQDDAFQSAIENLIRQDPADEGLRVLSMRQGISRALTKAAFAMSVPRSSFDKMKKAGALPDHLGDLIVDEMVFEIPEEDAAFAEVEDIVTVRNLLDSLDPHRRKVVHQFMHGKRPAYRLREQHRADLAETIESLRAGASKY